MSGKQSGGHRTNTPSSWLDLAKTAVAESFAPSLLAGGFEKRGARWVRQKAPSSTVAIQWSRFNSRASDFVVFWIDVSTLPRGVELFVGSDEAQAYAFANSGIDRFARDILGPIGLHETYQRIVREIPGEPSSLLASARLEALSQEQIDHARGVIASTHAYRWSDLESVGCVLREMAQAITHWAAGPRTRDDDAKVCQRLACI